MMRSNLVDLYTTDKELEDLMLSAYPGKLKGDQIKKDDSLDEKMYCFYSLDRKIVEKFLGLYRGQFSYEIVDLDTGERLSFDAAEALH